MATVNPAFGRHDVWIDSACLHVEGSGLSFKVKKADTIIGTLKVTDSHISWTPKGKHKARQLTWTQFSEKMAKDFTND